MIMSKPVLFYDDLIDSVGMTISTPNDMETQNPLSNLLLEWGPKKAVTADSATDWRITLRAGDEQAFLGGLAFIGLNHDTYPNGFPGYITLVLKDQFENLVGGTTLESIDSRKSKNLFFYFEEPLLMLPFDLWGDELHMDLSWDIDQSVTGDNYSMSRFIPMNVLFPRDSNDLCLNSAISLSIVEQADIKRTRGEQAHGLSSRRRRTMRLSYSGLSERTVNGYNRSGTNPGQFNQDLSLVDILLSVGKTSECVFSHNSEDGLVTSGAGIDLTDLADSAIYGHIDQDCSFSRQKDGTWDLDLSISEVLT